MLGRKPFTSIKEFTSANWTRSIIISVLEEGRLIGIKRSYGRPKTAASTGAPREGDQVYLRESFRAGEGVSQGKERVGKNHEETEGSRGLPTGEGD